MNDGGIYKSLECLANTMKQIKKKYNISLSFSTLDVLNEYAHSIPDDVKDTVFFHKVENLNSSNLQKEDIDWVVKDFGYEYGDYKDWLEKNEDEPELYKYIKGIINSTTIEKREKLVILLSHFESLLYLVIGTTRKPQSGIKHVVRDESVSDDRDMSIKSIAQLFVLAVTYIVFSNTDKYDTIDKRIPFRNNILHNGTISYNDDEINEAYELLVKYICMLVWLEKYYCD